MKETILTNDRQYGLDLIKILSALFIFLFHSNIHMNLTYGLMTPFVKNGAVFMVAFFELSGFTLYYLYSKKEMDSLKEIKGFFVKRIVNIYPLYIGIYIIYLFLYNVLTLKENIILAPIELTLTQSFFGSLFNVSHNNGTWFVSCIAFCYFVFPYFCKLFSQMKNRHLLILAVVLYFLCSIAPFVAHTFKLDSIYSNPFFRLMEFSIGMIVANSFVCKQRRSCNKIGLVFSVAALLIGVSAMSLLGIGNYSYYSFWVIPLFGFIIFNVALIKGKWFEKILGSRIIQYASKISYAFFLAQFFIWDIMKVLSNSFEILKINSVAVLFSLLICILIALVLHEIIENPVKKIFLKLNKRRNI